MTGLPKGLIVLLLDCPGLTALIIFKINELFKDHHREEKYKENSECYYY